MKTKVYSQSEFKRWAEIALYPEDKDIFNPQLPQHLEEEELWGSRWTPYPHQLYKSNTRLVRLTDTNWWLSLDYDKGSSRWIHLRNYLDWAHEVLPFIEVKGEHEICKFNRLREFPKIIPHYNPVGDFEVKIQYSDIDNEILWQYKYGDYQEIRPVNPVYALACYIHAEVQYSNTGLWCNADEYDKDGYLECEYNGLPDDLSVLIAHAAIVMCDRERVDNLELIRKLVMEFRKIYVDRPTYEDLIASNAIYMAKFRD